MSRKDIDREVLDEEVQGIAQVSNRGWWSRKPAGFLPTLLLVIVVLGGGAIYWSLFTRIFHLDVCQSGMQAIQASNEVQQALGQPITPVCWGVPPSTAS